MNAVALCLHILIIRLLRLDRTRMSGFDRSGTLSNLITGSNVFLRVAKGRY
jgi:hypothetical protein